MRTGPCYNTGIRRVLAALIALFSLSAASTRPLSAQQSAAPAASSLDFETFKGRVLPILISPRKGNARCVACHARGNAISFLEPLTPGADAYTDEQARRIFDRIQRVVVPGQPEKSPLLMNPLAEEAGGSHWHSGGKHWTSQSHPEFDVLVAWVRSNR